MVESRLRRVLVYVLVISVLVVFLFPLYWILVSSFKPYADILRGSTSLIPWNFTTGNYVEVLTSSMPAKNMVRFMQNSFLVSGLATAISVGLGILAGYAISDFKFKGRRFFRSSMLLVFLFPSILIAAPLMFQLKAVFGWADNLFALALIYSATITPISVWLISAFFEAIPKATRESAALDGASKMRTLRDIIIPLSAPGIFAAGAFSFITAWGEYLFSALLVTSNQLSTVPVGLARFLGSQYIEWGGLAAATFLTIIVVLIIFFPFAGKFLKGFMAGGVKG